MDMIKHWACLVTESENPEQGGIDREFVVGEVFSDGVGTEDFYEIADTVCGQDECASGLQDELDSVGTVRVNGNQTDVDDWDVWEVGITDCCGGWDGCFDKFAEWFLQTYKPEDRISFRKAFEEFSKYLEDNAQEMISSKENDDPGFLKRNGQLISKGGEWTSKSRFNS